MGPDDTICYCYDVSMRKLVNFAKHRNPQRPSQMSECLGAGTGCGWCIPILKRIFEDARRQARAGPSDTPAALMTPDEYAAARKQYIAEGRPRNQFD